MRDVDGIRLGRLRLVSGAALLDLGCARGDRARRLADAGLCVHGLEPEPALARICARALEGATIRGQVTVGDGEHLPYRDGSFAAVCATEVLEHVADPRIVLDETRRVLRRSGGACIAVPTWWSERLFARLHPYWRQDSGHVRVFRQRELFALLGRCGFEIEHHEQRNCEWSGFWLVHALLRTRFDSTGQPLGRAWLSRLLLLPWRVLDRLHLGDVCRRIGNRFCAKSLYVYVRRVDDA